MQDSSMYSYLESALNQDLRGIRRSLDALLAFGEEQTQTSLHHPDEPKPFRGPWDEQSQLLADLSEALPRLHFMRDPLNKNLVAPDMVRQAQFVIDEIGFIGDRLVDAGVLSPKAHPFETARPYGGQLEYLQYYAERIPDTQIAAQEQGTRAVYSLSAPIIQKVK